VSTDLRELGSIRLAAVGPATAQSLKARHLRIDLQPDIYTTERLAEAFSNMDVAALRFCLPHGNLADPFLANYLRERGAQVEEWKLYETQPEQADLTGVRARYLREGAHWITFTSSSTVENWTALQLEPVFGAPQPKAVSMGPVTSATLRKLGYSIAAEAPVATLDSLVATIRKSCIE
jgi:uroporphyrinogen III methyltransferase/synthase